MIYFLAGLPSIVLCLLLLLLFTGTAVTGLILIRRKYPDPIVKGDEIRGVSAVTTIIGALFGLLLALIVVTVWNDYQDQERRCVEEAVILGNLYRDSNGLGRTSDSIRYFLKVYTQDLITDSWPKMAEGKESYKAWASFNKLYAVIIKLPTENNEQQRIKTHMLDNLNDLAKYRRVRLFRSHNSQVPAGLWVVLLVTAVISIATTYFFRIGSMTVQVMITIFHSGVISIILFLVLSLMYPYRSGMKIKPESLEKLLIEVYPMADKNFQ